MTKAEIFVQIISEVSGKPKHELQEMFSDIRKANPGGKWDEKLSDIEAEKLLTELRTEAPGIFNWFLEGARRVNQRQGGTA